MPKAALEKLIFIILSILCVASLLLVSFLVSRYLHDKELLMLAAKDHTKQEMTRAAKEIDNELSQLRLISNSIANELGSGELTDVQVVDKLNKTMESNDKFSGIGVAYVPFVIDLNFRQSSPYYINKSEKSQIRNQSLIPILTSPFYTRQNKTGVVFIDCSPEDLKDLIIVPLDLGETGYGFVLSKKGLFLYHPFDEIVRDRKTIFDQAKSLGNEELHNMGKKAIDGESGVIELVDEITNQPSWMFFEPIRSTNWSMGVVIIKDKIQLDTTLLRKQLIQIGIGIIAFLLFISSLISRMKSLSF